MNLHLAEQGMWLEPVFLPMRHEFGHRFAVAADQIGLAIGLDFREDCRQLRFDLMNIDRFHGSRLSWFRLCVK